MERARDEEDEEDDTVEVDVIEVHLGMIPATIVGSRSTWVYVRSDRRAPLHAKSKISFVHGWDLGTLLGARISYGKERIAVLYEVGKDCFVCAS